MKKLYVLHLGIGNVGKEVITLVTKQKEIIKKDFDVSLEYAGKFTSKNSDEEIKKALRSIPLPFVLIDTTASDRTIPHIVAAMKRGGFVILANKKPLAGRQKDFDLLHRLGGQRLFYECVVGAGLPVIKTLKDLIITGDEVLDIQGCFSGTLGFLFSEMDNGKSFSESLNLAKERGFTEPDLREDLSGLDVARKALILARLIGRKIEFEDIKLTSLYPKNMQRLSAENFLKSAYLLDDVYKKKTEQAKLKNKVLRFVARIDQRVCKVGLQEVNITIDIGSLKGPDNLIVFKTKRYSQNPLVIKGPGAGIEVTAAGVFADLLSVIKIIHGGNI